MLPSRRLLAALLLAAVPLNAQTTRVSAPSLVPTAVVPGAVFAAPFLAAPSLSAPSLLTPSLSAAALTAAPAPSLPLSAIPAAAAAPALVPAAAPAEIPAAAAALAAAADGPARKGFVVSRAAPAGAGDITFGGRLFDGSSDLVTRSGSLFAPSRVSHPAVSGGFAFVRLSPAPAAPVKAVPDTQGLSGAALLERVSAITAKGQTRHEYHEASNYLFSTADNHTLNGVRGVADAYSGIFIPGTSADGHDYSENGDAAHDGWPRPQVMNVEHGFPQSYFQKDLPMRSDLHHLMATLEHPNGVRGNMPYGVVKGALTYHNDAGAKSDGRVFEPPDFTKGRVGRLLLYFYARYKNEPFFQTARAQAFWNQQLDVALDWNRRFPPTVEEQRTNDHIQAFQGNRNPFVDDPGLADRIGADALRAGTPSRPRLRNVVAAPPEIVKRSDKPRKGKKRSSYSRPHPSRRGNRR